MVSDVATAINVVKGNALLGQFGFVEEEVLETAVSPQGICWGMF
jgi:hypothetical protein